MFEKLKKLIFDESVELEPQEEDDFLYTNDSLENNKNLIKTQPINKETSVEPDEIIHEEPISDLQFRRIDVEEEVVESKETVEEVKPEVKPEVKKEESKPKPPVARPKPKVRVAAKNPQYYKPRAVISPMFGMSEQENNRSQQIETLTRPEAKTDDDKIISPMYGVLTGEQEIVTTKTKSGARRRKSVAVNMSLEEMLNMQSSDELEFTLFDVKVDKQEFQSRENQIIEDSNNE